MAMPAAIAAVDIRNAANNAMDKFKFITDLTIGMSIEVKLRQTQVQGIGRAPVRRFLRVEIP